MSPIRSSYDWADSSEETDDREDRFFGWLMAASCAGAALFAIGLLWVGLVFIGRYQ